ncbi:MAG: hypothetical protein JXB88_25450 [Spirochaetales bacterium]|nr:hypothetical protein [Spirochaetales bacterium]
MADMYPTEKENETIKVISNPLDATLYLLRCFARKYKTPDINFSFFLSFVNKVFIRFIDLGQGMRSLSSNPEAAITGQLEKLCEEKKCILEYVDEKISGIYFPQYFIDMIRKAYKEIEDDIQKPFPSEENLGITLPAENVIAINVQNDFELGMGCCESDAIQIIRLIFPETLDPLITTSDLLKLKLLELAALKIRLYLDNQRNAGYIENRLISFFKQKDIAVREMISRIMVRSGFIVNTILEPTEFTFRFWAHLTNIIIKEYMNKDNKLPNEQGYCHAACLLSLFNIYNKSIVQKELEQQNTLKILAKKLKRPPYLFTLNDIYHLQDKSGYPIIKKISKTIIDDYLKKKIQGSDPQSLPELIKIRTVHNRDYYIHKSSILPLTLNKIFIASEDLRKAYLANWIKLLKKHKKSGMMMNDLAFLKSIGIQLKNHFPMLYSLLDYNLLYLAGKDAGPDKPESNEIDRIFHKKKLMLIPLPEILGLNRKELLAEAKTHLPIWESIPVLKHIIRFLKKLFIGNRQTEEPEDDPSILPLLTYDATTPGNEEMLDYESGESQNELAGELNESKPVHPYRGEVYKTALNKLKEQIVGKDINIEEKLVSLAEKWNPLFDHAAREYLLEDVNSIIKDFLRRVKHTFKVQPPDMDRVRTLALTLSDNRSFDKITKKDYFLWYIEVYIVKLLTEMHIHLR